MLDANIRFADLLVFIENNLDSQLDTETLSGVVNLSKYHFHRQCKAAWGTSIYSVIKLLRMKRAAYLLAYRNDYNVLNIALMSGFDSHEAFSRSFKKIFGISPRAFRLAPDRTPWHKQYEPIIQLRNKIMSSNKTYEVDIVDFPALPLAVLEHQGAPSKLGSTIRKFIQWRKENGLPPTKERTFNLLYNDPNEVDPNNYRFDVCCSFNGEIQTDEYGIIKKSIEAGKCAVVRHVGSDDTIGQKVEYLYSSWLKEFDSRLRDFPLFFERVSFFPEVPESEMITDVYLPII